MNLLPEIRYYLILFVSILTISGCRHLQSNKKLPILGRKDIKETEVNGKITYDTIYHKIADFSFIDQDSNEVTNATFQNRIYVADFFFTTCPTICPIMKTQMLRVYEYFKDNDQVMFLSHTIDPDYDTVALLHDFADRLGVSSTKWHFVTGQKEAIYEIGQLSYMVTAMEDENAPGGYLHSGAFILVDKDRRIRGMYDGTSDDDVDRLIKDIPKLLKEYEH
jgi:protein SCO1/2